jgi:hypothetical protein
LNVAEGNSSRGMVIELDAFKNYIRKYKLMAYKFLSMENGLLSMNTFLLAYSLSKIPFCSEK